MKLNKQRGDWWLIFAMVMVIVAIVLTGLG